MTERITVNLDRDAKALNKIMEMDAVIRVHDDGTVSEVRDVHAPELWVDSDDDAQISDADERDMIAAAKSAGWELDTAYSVGGGLAIKYDSQFVGGIMADHILSTPGLWTATTATTAYCTKHERACEEEPPGDSCENDSVWVLAYREPEHPDDCLFCAAGQQAWEHDYRSCKGSGCEHGED